MPVENIRKIVTFLLDTGAGIDLIKEDVLDPDHPIDPEYQRYIEGVTDGKLKTLGRTYLPLRNQVTEFHVVDTSFPIEENGLLGRPYFRQNKAVISYHYNALAVNSDVLNPIPFLGEKGENISTDKNTHDCTPIRARREIRRK